MIDDLDAQEEALFEGASAGEEEKSNPENSDTSTNNTASEEQSDESTTSTENSENEEAETTEEVEANEDLPLVEELQNKVGLTFKGEDGKPIQYEDTPEGLTAYIEDVIKSTKETTLEEVKTDWLKTIPDDVKEYYNHRLAGGTTESFFTNPLKDIQNLILGEDDVDTAKQIISLRAERSGYNREEISDMIKGLEAGGKLAERGKGDLLVLQQEDKKIKQQEAEQVRLNVQAREKAEQEQLNTLTATIMSGKIDNIEIPVQEKSKFLGYLTVVGADGLTEYQRELNTLGDSVLIRDAYITYKKGNFDDIVKREIGKKQVMTLRDRVSRTSDKTHTSNNSSNNNFNYE